MTREERDFTNSFRALADDAPERATSDAEWIAAWRARDPDLAIAARANPQVIPRLHRIEAAISAALTGDLTPFEEMLGVVTRPFDPDPDLAKRYVDPPGEGDRVDRTFCGT